MIRLIIILWMGSARAFMTPPVGSIIQDSEGETLLNNFLTPLKTHAGVPHIPLHIIHDPSFNAFATFAGDIVIHTGCLMQCKSAAEFVAVLAHEVGHIVGHHGVKIQQEQTQALRQGVGLGLLAACLGAVGGQVASGLLVGSLVGQDHALSVYFSYQRTQEFFADGWAIKALQALSWPIEGFFSLMQRMTYDPQEAYYHTHPASRERWQRFAVLRSQKTIPRFPADIEEKFRRFQIKLRAYLAPLDQWTACTIPEKYPAWAWAIVRARQGDFTRARALIMPYLNATTFCPYNAEIAAQILWHNAQYTTAMALMRRVITQYPQDRDFLSLWSHMVLTRQHEASYTQVETLGLRYVTHYPQEPFLWHVLGQIYEYKKQWGRRDVCLAYKAFLQGNTALMTRALQRAMPHLQKDTVFLLKARDLEVLKNNVALGS